MLHGPTLCTPILPSCPHGVMCCLPDVQVVQLTGRQQLLLRQAGQLVVAGIECVQAWQPEQVRGQLLQKVALQYDGAQQGQTTQALWQGAAHHKSTQLRRYQ